MKHKRTEWMIFIPMILLIGICLIPWEPIWGYAREVSDSEKALRTAVVTTTENWLGATEEDNSHNAIIDIYNSHHPLARGYEVQYHDEWCSTFVSTISIQCGLTEIIPTECGCEAHINLFQELSSWEEDDGYIPLPGDIIFYHWDNLCSGDCTQRADHVGIVVGTFKNRIKIIEGNKDEQVTYRYLSVDHVSIRGYGIPDYASYCATGNN